MTLAARARRVVKPAALWALARTGDAGADVLCARRADPYPAYARARRRPLTRSRVGGWVTADHATAAAVLRDARFGVDQRRLAGGTGPPTSVLPDGRPVPPRHELLLLMDAPDHTRLRRLVAPAFSPRVVREVRAEVDQRAADLVGRLAADGGGDVVARLALPLPVAVISQLLGLPEADHGRIGRWGEAMGWLLEPGAPAERYRSARQADADLAAYFYEIVDERRLALGDDVLSRLLVAQDGGEVISDTELLAMAALVVVAGFETTVNLLANGLLTLLDAPDQLALLREQPDLAPNAVEELLRLVSPVQIVNRIALEPVELAGSRIEVGEQVLVLLAGANRDPSVFPDPDRLDLTRPNAADHLSFSKGAHHCLGAALARQEGEATFLAIAEQLTDIEVVARRWRPTRVLRGLEELTVRCRAR